MNLKANLKSHYLIILIIDTATTKGATLAALQQLREREQRKPKTRSCLRLGAS